MNTFRHTTLLSLSFLLASMALIGCGGAINFPDSVASASADGPPMNGSVYGGHAPIAGAHVYLLQPSTSAYGGVATSLLGNNGATSANGFALTANVNDPHVPTTTPVPEYVTSDSTGSFSFTGAYKCTVGQPVYVYAFGGNVGPTSTSSTTTFTVSSIKVTNAGTGANGTATYTFTINSPSALTAGQTVTVAGLNAGGGSIFQAEDDFAILDGTQTVLASPAPTATTFSITATNAFTFEFLGFDPMQENIANGTYPTTGNGGNNIGANGTVTVTTTTTNPAALNTSIVQLATLGNCPSSGNFSTAGNGALSFVFLNEVSTVAAAYTFQPFTVATNNDAWHIGTSGSTQAQMGIANAADTAAQLYSIQGNGPASSTVDGEGHIANATTPNGNGTVPQATIDTLADIIAACVDSTPGSGGAPSSQCSALFKVATNNGEIGVPGVAGNEPTDTATAVINIARYPDGNHGAGNVDATYASDLFAIASGTVPYTPELAKAPNDWTLAITYTGGTIGEANALSPHNIAVDGSGNIYHANFTANTFTVLSPLGVPTTITAPTTLNGPTSIALDSTSTNVWLANQNANVNTTSVTRCTVAGTNCVATELGSNLSEGQDAEIDGSGNVWATASDTGNNDTVGGGLVKITSATTPMVMSHVTTTLDEPTGLSIAAGANGLVWLADTANNDDISFCSATVCTDQGNVGKATENTAIDSSGNIWVAGNDTVAAIKSGSFASLGNSPITTGLGSINDGMVIDGNNTVWVVNNGAGTVLAFSATNDGTTAVGAIGEVSPNNGYTSALAPEGIATDPSGNVWYDTTNGGIVELVGAAAPTVTPLSAAVANSKLGTKP